MNYGSDYDLDKQRISCQSYNAKTHEVEKIIDGMFWKKDRPLKDVSTKNVKVIISALMTEYHKEYSMNDIDLSLYTDNGLSVYMKLDALDDNAELNHSTKDWLFRSLKNIVEVIGKPHAIFQSGEHFYALWQRNIVVWF